MWNLVRKNHFISVKMAKATTMCDLQQRSNKRLKIPYQKLIRCQANDIQPQLLADRTSVVYTECIVAKRCVLKQLLLTAYTLCSEETPAYIFFHISTNDMILYRTGHSTETALLEVLDGVYTAADDKQISVLIVLDLSAAFDTVDHSLLLERLHSEFAVTDTSLNWLRSYLVDRAQFVKMGRHQSDTVPLDVGVPQGSVLGPLLFAFAVYCSPVGDVISQHGGTYHQYADDTQLRLSMHADNTAEVLAVLAACTADVRQ